MNSKNMKNFIAVVSLVVAPASVIASDASNVALEVTAPVATVVQSGVQYTTDQVAAMFNALSNTIKELYSPAAVNALVDKFTSLPNSVASGDLLVQDVITTEVVEGTKTAAQLVGEAASVVLEAAQPANQTQGIAARMRQNLGQVSGAAIKKAQQAGEGISKSVLNAGAYAKNVASNAGTSVKGAGSYVKNALGSAGGSVKTGYDAVIAFTKNSFNTAENKLAGMYDAAAGKVLTLGSKLATPNKHVKAAVVIGTAVVLTGAVVWAVKSYLARRSTSVQKPEAPLLDSDNAVIEVVVIEEDNSEAAELLAEEVLFEAIIAENVN